MSDFPQEGHLDRTLDAADELTKLEYAASQGQLSAGEQQRLEQLRQEAGQIVKTQRQKAKGTSADGSVVSTDDSP